MKLENVGKALLPARASASTFKCSNLTSTVGISIPTLTKHTKTKSHERVLKLKQKLNSSKEEEKKTDQYTVRKVEFSPINAAPQFLQKILIFHIGNSH